MINWIKKYFIPHEINNYRPHFFTREIVIKIFIFILFLEIFTFLTPVLTKINIKNSMATVIPAILGDLTNEERKSQNLEELKSNPLLDKAAEMKAKDMAENGYFAHTSPEGKTPWYWLEQVGYSYKYAGENLAINFADSKDVTNAWMASPLHKANIIKDKYTEIGTGMAKGIYEGKETVFIAQIYANRAEEKIATNKNTTSIKIENEIKKEPDVKVLGAEIETNQIPNDVIVESIALEQTQKEDPSILQKTIASPRSSTNIIFFSIMGLIIISLILNIIIKIKYHHVDLITNALILIITIGAILIVNYYITHKNMTTTQSVDYSYEDKNIF